MAGHLHSKLSINALSQVFEALGDGSVIGVIPDALQPREVSGKAVGEVRVVGDMHTRKVSAVPASLAAH